LSRCRVITLKSLDSEDIAAISEYALKDRERGLGSMELFIEPEALAHLIRLADGDARMALNNLDIAADMAQSGIIRLEDIENALQKNAFRYDKSGEEHYNLMSAFHKSLRGSDPDAALYWLARMLTAGEDPLYVARRMVRFASEDVGNADPYALHITLSAMEAYRFLGSPEGELMISLFGKSRRRTDAGTVCDLSCHCPEKQQYLYRLRERERAHSADRLTSGSSSYPKRAD